jgi:hypothetical protein
VQEGQDANGTLTRWSFSEITPDTFHWRGERSSDRGWRLQVEVFARRVK